MGGIVKAIGKAIKGIGKALKKIAPILLVAAAIYIGYGFMTGFQAGGWPQITNWGKSLVSGVGQGQTISQAATAATDMTAMAGGPTTAALGAEAVTTALPAQEAVTSTALSGLEGASTGMIGQVGDVASTVAEGGMGLPSGAPPGGWAVDAMAQTQPGLTDMYSKFDTGWTDTTKGILADLGAPSPISTAQASQGLSQGSTFVPELGSGSPINYEALNSNASINQAAANQVMSTDGMGIPTGAQPRSFQPSVSTYDRVMSADVSRTDLASVADFAGPHGSDPSFPGKLMQLGKKAWSMYKQMWADNPGMAMWTTSNVLKTILAMLDDTEEKLAHRRAHVGGFAPGGYDEVAARYGGNLPGGRGGGGGFSGAGASGSWSPRRSMAIKTGPIPEANRGRSSAINLPSPGIIGTSKQGQV